MARRLVPVVVAVVATVATVAAGAPAAGGGWAITVIDPFEPPQAHEVLDVSFTILQHGAHPVDVDGVALVVTGPDGQRQRVPAERAGDVGRYRASIELRQPGRHRWMIRQGWFGPQDLGSFDVADVDRPTPVDVPIAAAVVGFAGAAGLFTVGVRRRALRRVSPSSTR